MQLMPCFCALCPPMLTGSCCRHFPKHGQLPPRSPSISFSLSRGFLASKRSLQSLKQAQPRRAEASAPLGQGQFSTSGRWKSVDQCSSPPILQWHDSEHGWLLLHDLNLAELEVECPFKFCTTLSTSFISSRSWLWQVPHSFWEGSQQDEP